MTAFAKKLHLKMEMRKKMISVNPSQRNLKSAMSTLYRLFYHFCQYVTRLNYRKMKKVQFT